MKTLLLAALLAGLAAPAFADPGDDYRQQMEERRQRQELDQIRERQAEQQRQIEQQRREIERNRALNPGPGSLGQQYGRGLGRIGR